MPVRAVMAGVILVVMVSVLAFMAEFFIPISVKSDMNIFCRNTLLQMETKGGLSGELSNELRIKLENSGFKNIKISGTNIAKYGGGVQLRVEADYTYNKLTGLVTRSDMVEKMVYERTSVSRRVVN